MHGQQLLGGVAAVDLHGNSREARAAKVREHSKKPLMARDSNILEQALEGLGIDGSWIKVSSTQFNSTPIFVE